MTFLRNIRCGAGRQSALYRLLTASSIVLPTYLHVLSLWLMATTLAGAGRRRRRGSWSLLFVYGPITLLHFTSSTSIN